MILLLGYHFRQSCTGTQPDFWGVRELSGDAEAVTAPGSFLMVDPLTHVTPDHFLSIPGLWIGLILAAAFLAAGL
jgi:hypothetical protein